MPTYQGSDRGRMEEKKGKNWRPVVEDMLPDVYPSPPESEAQTRVQLSPRTH